MSGVVPPAGGFVGPTKRSITIAGHATSISLEPMFWQALEEAARRHALPLSALVAQIDALRIVAPDPPNLASALRSWLFDRPPATDLRLVPFSDELAPAFHDINAAWIEAMFTLEETDRIVLTQPRDRIIAPGGDILFVAAPGLGIVGTGALQRTGPGQFELTKMGVRESARGQKAGEFLLHALIRRAGELGAERLYLLTNARCQAAIHLYEKAGFRHDAAIMAEFGARYARCDVAMIYDKDESQSQ